MKSIFLRLILFSFVSMTLIACGGNLDSNDESQALISSKRVDSINEIEKKVLVLVNDYRASKNLVPLELNSEISTVARSHSKNMADGSVDWGHGGYEERAKVVSSMISWDEFGENLAKNNFNQPASASLESWIDSPMHHDNLLGEFNFTGIGVALNENGEYFITQIFVRS